MADCGTCNTLITAVPDSITCDGLCQRSFHMRCANINRALLKQIAESTNIHYFCDACKAFTFRGISGQLTDLKDSIAKLYDAMSLITVKTDELTTTAAKLSDVVADNTVTANKLANTSSPSMARAWPELREVASAKKRRMISSPSSRQPSMNTTTQPNNIVVGTCDSNEDVDLKSVEPRRLVVVSQLHPTTTADSMIIFTNKKLNLPPDSKSIRATMLIQKGRDVSEMDFVSCKLSIPQSSYAPLMNASIWPAGVTIRDFVNLPRRNGRNIGHFLPSAEVPDPTAMES